MSSLVCFIRYLIECLIKFNLAIMLRLSDVKLSPLFFALIDFANSEQILEVLLHSVLAVFKHNPNSTHT